MPALPQRTLKVVPAPLVEAIPTAPPVLEEPNSTVEFKCGNCGAVLMRVNERKAYPLIIRARTIRRKPDCPIQRLLRGGADAPLGRLASSQCLSVLSPLAAQALSASLLGFRAFQYWHSAQLRETVSPVAPMPPCGSVVPLSPRATPASRTSHASSTR
jgi:hypothetical protein